MGTLITIVYTDEITGRARNDVSGHPEQLTSSRTTHVIPDNSRHPGPDPGSGSSVWTNEFREFEGYAPQ